MQHQPANIYKRIIAVIIDHLIVNFLLYLLFTKFYGMNPADPNLTTSHYLIFVLFNLGYFVILEAVFAKTIGKKILNLEIRETGGAKIKPLDSIVRNLLRPIDFICFYLFGMLFVANTARSQRLGDILAGTYVVESR